MIKYFHSRDPFLLESGELLPEITIAYHSYGKLDHSKNNVVWVCHALTANSDPAEWWPGVVGKGSVIDPDKYFIVCANILGSCYGTTGPLSLNPQTGQPYYDSFPLFTIRDIVKAHQLLSSYLKIERIHLLMGGSMGGYQALEWCAMEPEKIEKLFLVASSARETPWGIAIHTAQRMAIEADSTWLTHAPDAGEKGLQAARAIAMLTYRNYNTYQLTQKETDPDKTDHFKASSYIRHQGKKLASRFNAYTYWWLSKALDSHNLARKRKDKAEDVLATFKQKTLVIGIKNDLLCPLPELDLIASHIPDSVYHQIESMYGHDGFLTEHTIMSKLLKDWL